MGGGRKKRRGRTLEVRKKVPPLPSSPHIHHPRRAESETLFLLITVPRFLGLDRPLLLESNSGHEYKEMVRSGDSCRSYVRADCAENIDLTYCGWVFVMEFFSTIGDWGGRSLWEWNVSFSHGNRRENELALEQTQKGKRECGRVCLGIGALLSLFFLTPFRFDAHFVLRASWTK